MGEYFEPGQIQSIAIVGGGVIGASWAALYIANGLEVVVYDCASQAEASLWPNVRSALKCLEKLDNFRERLSRVASPLALLSFTTDLHYAVSRADLIQENAPENLPLKLDLLASIDKWMKPHAILCSSTSGLRPSDLQAGLSLHKANFVVGHPFNPPHLMPLVEVVGGRDTCLHTIQRAMRFYDAVGKKPVHVQKEVPGHIANRLQAALFREIFAMLANRTATVADIETAMEYGPGLRWGIMGPSVLLHLGGGAGGAEAYAQKFMAHLMSWYAAEDPVMDDGLVEKWVTHTTALAEQTSSRENLERTRDDLLVGILNRKGRSEK
ncbi:3-hydroxyacyl-CoA dehydrogenase [Aspergillus sclerotiicarbonarius CBS 121057]|uniref:3-hydroxyacyl-CoA dehydrogenase n=1 Tax=Aspergillus sclerotiicarbonarius (strain CBS 121057 / IBT 28362) TaxID=1448318 RepID=A0A319EA81_ASPSB|nr:3-hydroxyacyl-CoA dehydrogenase [Aspergillus sclerotiicarbonarius CBS 121057]